MAFCTGHVVPGIGFSDDPLLHGRNFSYQDTQVSRLGINFQEIPINRPVCPVMNNNRDGRGRHTIVKGNINYWPNRFESAPPAKPTEGAYIDHPAKVEGRKMRMKSKKFQEHYSQAQLFYNSMSEPEKMHMQAALSFELDHCDDPLVFDRYVQRLADIDLSLAQNVAENVGAKVPQKANLPNPGKKSAGLSQTELAPKEPTIASRRVAIMIADGYDPVAYNGMLGVLKGAKAFPYTIGPRRNPIYAAGESRDSSNAGIKTDHHFEGMRSTMFDSIFIPGGADSIKTLRSSGRALHWVREAFAHLKAIGGTGEAIDLIRDACELPGMEFSTESVVDSYGVVTAAKVQPESFKEALKMAKGAAEFVDAYTYAISQHKNFDRELKGFNMMVAY